jgi:hypothetical protein
MTTNTISEHTPGPWTVHNFGDDSWEILTETDSVAEVQDNLDNPGRSEADARLIAAAPALAEALERVLDWFGVADAAPGSEEQEVTEIARAALALTGAPTEVKA